MWFVQCDIVAGRISSICAGAEVGADVHLGRETDDRDAEFISHAGVDG